MIILFYMQIYLNLLFANFFMTLFIKGRIISGLKEGAYYVAIYKDKIEKICGFHPFTGTLNIDCNAEPLFPEKTHFIGSFKVNGAEFGAVWLYPATFKGEQAFVLVPDLAKHTRKVIEIISPNCLRTKYGLKDGDHVEISIHPVDNPKSA